MLKIGGRRIIKKKTIKYRLTHLYVYGARRARRRESDRINCEVCRPFWTDRLPTNELYFFLESADPAAKIRLAEYVAMSATAKRPYYSIQGAKEVWVDLFESPLETVDTFHRRKGDAVGMLVAHSGSNLNGFKVWSCSGFLIAGTPKMLFVTNDHCGGPWSAEDRWSPYH